MSGTMPRYQISCMNYFIQSSEQHHRKEDGRAMAQRGERFCINYTAVSGAQTLRTNDVCGYLLKR